MLSRLKPIHALIATALVTVIVGIVVGLYFNLLSTGRSNRVIDQWHTTNGNFDIRVQAFGENGWVSGAYYVFESARHGSNEWREIMTFRHDDPLPIPKEQIRFINESTAFVFMGWMYAVTTDSGASWSVWSAKGHIPEWGNYSLIESVRLEFGGEGKMKLDTSRKNALPELKTTDYGRHWN